MGKFTRHLGAMVDLVLICLSSDNQAQTLRKKTEEESIGKTNFFLKSWLVNIFQLTAGNRLN